MMPLINPVEFANQAVVLVLISVILALMVRHWRAVLIALTGDDRVHGSVLDCVYFTLFRCCGLCTGEETKWITNQPCCCCLPAWMRGRSFAHEAGKLCGFTHYVAELKNIVIGDLPWEGRGDFYLCVECAGNPPRMTSLAEDQTSKVVHFPEVVTLRLRNNPLEQEVKITVKELRLWGSSDLCSVHIPAMSILRWAGTLDQRVKRFEMKLVRPQADLDTPPWILMEMSESSDERHLDFRNVPDRYVRTRPTEQHNGEFEIGRFKQMYTLLDHTGHAIQEPLEDDLRGIECRITCVDYAFRWSVALGVLAVVVALCLCFYTASCWHGIRDVTIADMKYKLFAQNITISRYELENLVSQCHREYDGTGDVMLGHDACLPTQKQVMQRCLPPELGGIYPRKQPPVMFMEGALSYLGVDGGLPCGKQECEFHLLVKEWKVVALQIAAMYVLYLVCLWCCGRACIRSHKRHIQESRAHELRTFQQQRMMGGSTSAGSPVDHPAWSTPGHPSNYEEGTWVSAWGSPGGGTPAFPGVRSLASSP